jgi:hypothetical protein
MQIQEKKVGIANKVKISLLIIMISIPFVIFIYRFPTQWAGWLIFVLTFLIPLFIKTLRSNKTLILVTYAILCIHHSIAFVNSYIGPTFGAEKDAFRFHRDAAMMSQFSGSIDLTSLGSSLYTSFLAICYKFFGNSKFLGSELSVLAFLLSLIIILKIAIILKKKNYLTHISILYGMLPTSIFYTSVTLREPFEMLFFSLTLYYGLKFKLRRNYLNLIRLTLCLFLMGILHNGLLVAVPFIFIIIVMFSLDGSKIRLSFGVKLILLSIISIFVLSMFFVLTKIGLSTDATSALFSGEIMEYSGGYAKEAYSGGSSYGANLDTSSPLSFFKTIIPLFISYMFAPFPWQIRGIMDIYAALESVLRLLLLYFAWQNLKLAEGLMRKKYLLVFFIFILIELLWSTGTQNWGTAMRHHLIAYGILLIMGIDGILNILNKNTRQIKEKLVS